MKWFVLIPLILVLLACNDAAPVIEDMEWRVIFRDSDDSRREELMLYLRIVDEDDEDDPVEITIVAEGTGLQWVFLKEEWVSTSSNGQPLWGMPAIQPYEGTRLPDVLYTVNVIDLSGLSGQQTFRLDAQRPTVDEIDWPSVVVTDNILRYSGSYEHPKLMLRNSDLKTINTHDLDKEYPLSEIDAQWWDLWINLDDIGSGIRIGPYRLMEDSP